ncbi:MAG: 1-acyl-sn-glycerol-3-phosphate acyltransferase [Bacteroidetes bacterium]|jgi:glycerol-3-phosphate O-acyltransferase|nr:1-acyl-sn-glycerol-3-phosphate acyltransferase [Bacteroidota bacterium]MBK7137673.1 1-acyl-sn-glycerol-3-phosphate acyltransferase [Bacteroidota bacterium]MBP7257646.1 1-acyl-sn-glycerol-3-phosphate acyltransferase [Chitinophagales bacterium]
MELKLPNPYDFSLTRISRNREKLMEEVIAETISQFNKEKQKGGLIRDELAKTLYLERARIKTEPWKVDPEDDFQFWGHVKNKLAKSDPNIEGKEVAIDIEQQLLKDIVTRYVHEITGNFNPRFFLFARQILPMIFSRLLNASFGKISGIFKPKVLLKDRLFVTGPLEKLRKLREIGTLILVPTHFSNLDSIMVGYGMDMVGLGAFQYGAGLNLFNSKLFSFFMSNLGPYKLDRRKKNSIYLETLKTYSRTTILHGAPTLFFPGGTRSRAGNIEKSLKLGLLGTVIEAQRIQFEKNPNNLAKKLFIVPITTSYHFVLEASSLMEENLKKTGKEQYIVNEKPISGFKLFTTFFSALFGESSEITLSMGEPMDVFGNICNEEGESFDKFNRPIDISKYFESKGKMKPDDQRESQYTAMLGDTLVEKFYQNNVVYSSHTVAFVAFELLKKKFKKEDIYSLLRLPEEDLQIPYNEFLASMRNITTELFNLNNNNKLKLAFHMTKEVDEIITHGIKNVGMYHAKKPIYKTKDGFISSEDLKLLLYYHNRLEGYGLSKFI